MLPFGQNGNGSHISEKKIIELMVSDYSWEQILYDIVAVEGMDPWNVDLTALSSTFLNYISKIKELDFRLPAKFIIIASLFLRMKSDNLRLTEMPDEHIDTGDEIEFSGSQPVQGNSHDQLMMEAMSFPINRRPEKQISVTDLVFALKKVLDTQERKDFRISAARSQVILRMEGITQKINNMHAKINEVLGKIKGDEVKFSSIVGKWDRANIIDTFMPVVYLDHEKKLQCRQEQFFDEIFIRKLNGSHTNSVQLNGHTNSHIEAPTENRQKKLTKKAEKNLKLKKQNSRLRKTAKAKYAKTKVKKGSGRK